MHSLVSGDQILCDMAFDSIINNLRQLIQRAWDVTEKFIEMENRTENMSDEEKSPHKDEYGKDQLALEQCLECAVGLLDFYFLNELEEYDADINQNKCIIKTLKKN